MSENALEKITALARQEPHFDPMAYLFVFEALDYVGGHQQHVTGQMLADGVRRLAIERFGPLAKLVLQRWGIRSTREIGAAVYQLISVGLMGKRESDDPSDFDDVFDFCKAFSVDQTVRLPE